MLCLLFAAGARAQGNLERGKQYYEQARWNSNNYKNAAPYLQAAAKEGYGEACFLLGNMYRAGNGVEKNPAIAMRMFQRSLDFGYALGEAELGEMYHFGEGCKVDKQKSIELFRRSAAKHIENGILMLGQCYYYGDGVDRNYDEAFRLLRSITNEKYLYSNDGMNSIAVAILARCYRYGLGVQADTKKALAYYGKGNPKTLLEGALFMDELGESAYRKAECINRAIWMWNSRDPEIYYYSALWTHDKYEADDRHLTGRFDDSDKKEVFARMQYAAEQGFAPAQKILGDWLAEGVFTSVNLMKAREWYAKAQANGIEIEEKRPQQQQSPQEKGPGIYAVGDVYRSPESKAAVGVVVSVDASGRHGLAFSFTDDSCDWETASGKCAGGWRLPTRSELHRIQSFKDLLSKTEGCGRIFSQLYWSSEAQGDQAWAVSMIQGKESEWPKTTPNSARYVLEF